MQDDSESTIAELQRKIRQLEAEIRSLRAFESAPHLAVLEDMSECIVRWQVGGILIYVNDAYCSLFNISRDALLGTSFMELILEQDRVMVQARLDALTPDNPISTGRHRAMRPDGSQFWMEWCDRLIFDAAGSAIEYQSVGRDITERVHVQEQLREIEKSEAVARHTFELAHDLNNVFTVILGQLELLKLDPGGSLAPLEAGVNKGMDLLQQIRELRYSYLWQPRLINLNEHVSADLVLLRELASSTPIHFEITQESCKINGDAIQLDQLLWNLVRNADQAANGQGAIRVRVSRKRQQDLLPGHQWATGSPEECCVLQVADEAEGIPEALKSNLFSAHISTRPEGQGLGLQTVKSIVDAHNASISFASSGNGTVFEVAFPAV